MEMGPNSLTWETKIGIAAKVYANTLDGEDIQWNSQVKER